MHNLNNILSELGISKVRLAKYLGVSRQMLYNYLSIDDISKWPKEKGAKLLTLLDIKEASEIENISVTGEYIINVEKRLNDGVKESSSKEILADLKGFNKKEQELLSDILGLLKDNLANDKSKDTYNAYLYLYNFLKSMNSNEVLKFILAYMSKSLGFTPVKDFVFNADKQYIFESIMFSAMTLYENKGNASKVRLAASHKKFEEELERKHEEKLSRTQELSAATVQALKELNYNGINDDNAKEVLDKIAEIQSRRI